jgi:uncharacterized repeat protein (TIGR03803 family)
MNRSTFGGLKQDGALRVIFLAVLLILLSEFSHADAQTLTRLWSFTVVYGFFPTNGTNPYATLVEGKDGYFYGTTRYGGPANYGTVFRIGPGGDLTNLYCFSPSKRDGINPDEGLVQGSDSNFYGTTANGGTNHVGVVYRISPSGSFTNLHTFSYSVGPGSDGFNPNAILSQGSDGNFYGTTAKGGASTNCPFGCGTIFRISPTGNLTNLYSFNGSDGQGASGKLFLSTDGSFYGTTAYGGVSNLGTVFRFSPNGGFENLYSFKGPDGAIPIFAGLVLGRDGNFYGTTSLGGASNTGTVFRITASGTLTTLYSFTGGSDGANPEASLVQGSDGNFYGTAYQGGNTNFTLYVPGYGTLFQITPTGSLTTVHLFNGDDGLQPAAGLVQGSDGSFYGTTVGGYTNAPPVGYATWGTVFKWTVPLNPPANQISEAHISGTDAVLSIPSVAAETYQLQFTTDLTSGLWSNIAGASVTNGIGALLTVTNFGGAVGPQGFYRFDITP